MDVPLGSMALNLGSWIQDSGSVSMILYLECRILDLGSMILGLGSWIQDHVSRIHDPGSRVMDLEPRVQDP